MIDPNAFTRIASPWIPRRARNPVEFGQEYVVGRVVDGLPLAGFEVYPVENLGKLRVQSLTVIADEEKSFIRADGSTVEDPQLSPRCESQAAAGARWVAQDQPPSLLRVHAARIPPEREAPAGRERPAGVAVPEEGELSVGRGREPENPRARDLLPAERHPRFGVGAVGGGDGLQHDERRSVGAPARAGERARRVGERLLAARPEREGHELARALAVAFDSGREPLAARAGPRVEPAGRRREGPDPPGVHVDPQGVRARQA